MYLSSVQLYLSLLQNNNEMLLEQNTDRHLVLVEVILQLQAFTLSAP